MRKPKRVAVKWEDSAGTGGWHRHEDRVYGTVMCYSTGFLVESKKQRLVIALNWNEGQYGEYMSIPRSAIRKVRKLK